MNKNEIKQIISKILKKNQIKRASYFGSILNENFNENSDVDILVEFQNDDKSLLDLIGLKQEIENRTNINIDLLTYNSINPALKEIILKDQEIII